MSCTSFPSGCATATDCSPRRSSACTPRACTSSSRWTAASAAPTRRGARASWASISSSPTITSPTTSCRVCCAVVNPKRHDCQYPDKHLAGVGVALKLVQALCQRTGRTNWLPAFVKVAAIGTLADVVPLVGENRVIAKLGLQMLSKGPHKVGLRALLDVAGLAGKTDRQLSHRVHGRAARQRRRTHEHARHRHASAARGRRRHGRRGADAGRAARGREPAPPPGGAGHRREGEEDDRDRSGSRIALRARRRRRGLAPRRHRDRGVEDRGRVLSSDDRPLDRGRHRARVVPQHPRIRHARGDRIVCPDAAPVRRPQAGGRSATRKHPHQGVPPGDQRVGRGASLARRPPPAPLARRPARPLAASAAR